MCQSIPDSDINYVLETLKKFSDQYPELINDNSEDFERRITNALTKDIIPSIPETYSDPLVSVILEGHYKLEKKNLEKIANWHKLSMASENIVGEYLELYISSKTHPNRSWVHCVDNLVKSTDFVKHDKDGWKFLQIKNRYNSENSSSSRIRKTFKKEYGILIKKWYRTRKDGTDNWSIFPDKNSPDKYLSKVFSEADFKNFIFSYLNHLDS